MLKSGNQTEILESGITIYAFILRYFVLFHIIYYLSHDGQALIWYIGIIRINWNQAKFQNVTESNWQKFRVADHSGYEKGVIDSAIWLLNNQVHLSAIIE